MEALSLLPKDRQQVTFGQRRSKGLVDHVMPFDLISYVEGYNREATTHFQLASAVDTILGTCLQSQHRGGYIAGLGAGGRLHVTVTFNIDVRNVRCFEAPDTPPTETGCGNVLDTVPVSAERQIFGPKNNYGVEVVLPQVFRERKYPDPGCVIAVDPYGQQSMTASWLLVFAAANSVNAMCVRRGKEGRYVAYEFGLRKAVVGLYYRDPYRI
ncbi:MAG: hypothetical protein LQ339_005594 [Xanthoria mediterranea]|nr:MAG: hypothetical protein LQ339_005594 [Xanthoria mediterranea]